MFKIGSVLYNLLGMLAEVNYRTTRPVANKDTLSEVHNTMDLALLS